VNSTSVVSLTILAVAVAFQVLAGVFDNAAERSGANFVTLALQLASLKDHGDEIDAYFGPESQRPSPGEPPVTLDTLTANAGALLTTIEHEQEVAPTPRGARQLAQVRSFVALLRVIEQPRRSSLEQEAWDVYRMSMPVIDQVAAKRALTALNAALPGRGSLSQRLAEFESRFVVPPERRQAVFTRALQECRQRTLAHWKLPPEEQLDVEWTSSVDAAWHRYLGHGRSTLQINPQAVALIGSAIDVACHEAYPGHHAQFVVMEQNAGAAGLPVENQVVLLRSPASVLREGAANFGVELAFPWRERIAFDREVLFPLAGLPPAQARRYETVHRLVDELASAVTPILTAYRSERLSFGEAASELVTDAQILEPAPLLQFTDKYGAYALGYVVARDRIRDYVNEQSRRSRESSWSVLRRVVAEPDVSVLEIHP
jgi:hypothetical protein